VRNRLLEISGDCFVAPLLAMTYIIIMLQRYWPVSGAKRGEGIPMPAANA